MASCKELIGVGSNACWFLFVFAFPIKTREVVPKHEAGGTRNNNFFVCWIFTWPHYSFSLKASLSFQHSSPFLALRELKLDPGLRTVLENPVFTALSLSSPEAFLCCREAGEKEKESARGAMVRGKSFLFFDYCYFYWDTQREPLRRRELPCSWWVCKCWIIRATSSRTCFIVT